MDLISHYGGFEETIEKINSMDKNKDLEKLIEIVKNVDDYEIQSLAIKKIDSEKILTEIVKTGKNHDARELAVEKIETNESLMEIINMDNSFILQNFLKYIQDERGRDIYRYRKFLDYNIRNLAISKITDEKILEFIAKYIRHPPFRMTAINKITDEKTLIEIAKIEEEVNIRYRVVEKISNEEALADIVNRDEHPLVRLIATEKIENEKILKNISTKDLERDIRLEARKKIKEMRESTHQTELIKVSNSEKDLMKEKVLKEIVLEGKVIEEIVLEGKVKEEIVLEDVVLEEVVLDKIKELEEKYEIMAPLTVLKTQLMNKFGMKEEEIEKILKILENKGAFFVPYKGYLRIV